MALVKREVDSREGLFVIVGFDAANIMRSRGIQSLHEKMKRIAELKQTEKHSNNMSINTDVTESCREQLRAHLMSYSLPVIFVGSFGSRLCCSDVHSG